MTGLLNLSTASLRLLLNFSLKMYFLFLFKKMFAACSYLYCSHIFVFKLYSCYYFTTSVYIYTFKIFLIWFSFTFMLSTFPGFIFFCKAFCPIVKKITL